MTIIYRKNDLISLEIGDLVFKIKPLNYLDRVEIMSCLHNSSGTIVENAGKASYLTIKYAVKKLEGASTIDGTPYELEFDESGNITDDAISDILNIEENNKLGLALHNFLKGVPSKLIDPNTGDNLEGVKIINQGGVPKK